MDCPQHKIVSLVGNIAPDGSASLFDVVSRIGDRVKAPHYPMPLPVIATTVHEKIAAAGAEDRCAMSSSWRRQADVTFVGIGTVDEDGRPAARRLRPARMKCAPWCGPAPWARSPAGPSIADGTLIDGLTNDRVLSVPLEQPARTKVIGVAMALPRLRAIKGALRGKLINGLITNEMMAELLLE